MARHRAAAGPLPGFSETRGADCSPARPSGSHGDGEGGKHKKSQRLLKETVQKEITVGVAFSLPPGVALVRRQAQTHQTFLSSDAHYF